MSGEEPAPQMAPLESPHVVSSVKLPILKKAKSIFLLAIPDEYQLRFHGIKDAKSLSAAIKSRFGGNVESKKMQKNVLKQQFENFSVSNIEGLDKAYVRFQKLINLLEVYGAAVFNEDANQKFLRALPLSWNNVALIMRNKTEDTNSINEVNTVNGVSTASSHNSQGHSSSSSYTGDLMFSFFANQSNSLQLDDEDLEQIDHDNLEEMDLKGQVAMLSMRVKRFYKKTGRKLIFNGKEPVGQCFDCARWIRFDWSYIAQDEATKFALMAYTSGSDTEVQSCSKNCVKTYEKLQKQFDEQRQTLSKANLEIVAYQLGLESVEAQLVVHQKNEVVYEEKIAVLEFEVKDKGNAVTRLTNQLEQTLKEKEDLKAKLEQFETSSKNLNKLINSQISSKDKTGLGYGDQLNENDSSGSELFNSVFDSRSSDGDDNQTNDRFKKDNEYHVVPPPLTGNYIPPLTDLSFAGLDDSIYRPTTNKASSSVSQVETSITPLSNTSVEMPRVKFVRPSGVIIEDWVSDDDEDIFQSNDSQTIVKPSFKKIEFTKARNEPVKSDKQAVNLGWSLNLLRVNGVNTAGQTVVSVVKGNGVTAVKASTGYVWRPKMTDLKNVSKNNSGSWVSKWHMTGNKDFLNDYQDIDGGFVAFGRSARSGIEAIRLFLAYASFMNFLVYQMDVKSAFLYGTIEEEVYVSQPPGFVDPEFPEKVYKVEKALYGLHQAPRAWYETLSTYLLDNGFYRGQIDKTLFIKRVKDDILLVQVYVDDIIFGSTKKSLCTDFEQIMHKRFQMSSIGELTFFLGLQVKQKEDGIFISQDKYVGEILKKFSFSSIRTASTPMETNKALTKDEDGEDVDVHLYRSMIGSLMYLTSSRPDIMFSVCACSRFQVQPKVSHLNAVKRIFRYLKGRPNLGLWYPKDSPFILEAFSDSDYAGASLDRKSTTGGCQFLGSRLISWQCKKQTVVANSTTEAEYIVASHCYGQVLWIQNQMLDYGYNFMQTKIHVDNESAICVVKNPGMDLGGSPRRQDTMGGGALAQTRMEHQFELTANVPITPHDLPLPGVYTPRSDEGRLKLQELMTMCIKLSKQVLDLEKKKDAQAVEILRLKKRVKRLERQRKSSTSQPRRRKYR
ncbi:putative ribonuclease H-like domain-containing protein [Tanacetum coccineum]